MSGMVSNLSRRNRFRYVTVFGEKNDVLMMSFIVKPVVNGDSIFQPSDVWTFTGFIATVGGAEKFHGAAL